MRRQHPWPRSISGAWTAGPDGDASGATPGDRLPNKARAGLPGIAAVLPVMDDGCWHRRQRAPSGVILAMREEMSGSTLKR
jgi:hypothetical protein